MTSDKEGAALIAEIFARKGFEHIVISPGSRNAPFVIAFTQNPLLQALNIVDERSAAYFALGIAQQTGKTVAITCTSGGAALNYAPAIAEAYYQKIPLLVLTADRPPELIDQGDGQTIRQKNLYANYIRESFEISGELQSAKEVENAISLINTAIDQTLFPDGGPVHINMPFREPIYHQVESHGLPVRITKSNKQIEPVPEEKIRELANTWNHSPKKLLIAGMMDPNPKLDLLLKTISDDPSVVILSETTSNLKDSCDCSCIDKSVFTILETEKKGFQPNLLLTFGGNVVSKMVKSFIRNNQPEEHWHIHESDFQMDTYHCLTEGIQSGIVNFLEKFQLHIKQTESDYKSIWNHRRNRSEERHRKFLAQCDYSDLKIFETLVESIPENSIIQLGNSTPVRYFQLFKFNKQYTFYSNRGTSGIDGTVSTAAGAAWASKKPTTLITGELGFLYDSNALMNHHLKGNLRIIIINNSGGGIFRFIPGPDTTDQLEDHFEAHHRWNAEFIARNYSVPYYSACNLSEMQTTITDFYKDQPENRPAILEIFTPNKKNGRILRSYFNYLKE